MRARVESLTTLRLFSARETVAVETPAFLATASRLIRLSFLVRINSLAPPTGSHGSYTQSLKCWFPSLARARPLPGASGPRLGQFKAICKRLHRALHYCFGRDVATL